MRAFLANLKKVGVIVLVAIGVLILVNAIDEKLAPEAAAYATPPVNDVPAGQNAFFAMLGFFAAGDDIHAQGQLMAQSYEQALAQHPMPADFEIYRATGGKPLEIRGDLNLLCNPRTAPCLDSAAAHERELEQMLQDNAMLTARYRSLYGYPHFQATFTPSIHAPTDYVRCVTAQGLLLSGIALQARRGNWDGAVTALADDARFWRRMSGEPQRDLLGKLVALRMMQKDLRLASELIHARHLSRTQAARLTEMLAPPSAQERDWSGSIQGDYLDFWRLIQDEPELLVNEGHAAASAAGRLTDRAALLFFSRNATLNRIYHNSRQYQDLAALPASQFVQARAELDQRTQAETEMHWWQIFHNPIGHMILQFRPDYARFFARMHDIEGLRRLVALQLKIQQDGIADAKIGAFAQAAGPDYANPYTGQPMVWDAQKKTLTFEGKSGDTPESVAVTL